jgi:hypothetical protein
MKAQSAKRKAQTPHPPKWAKVWGSDLRFALFPLRFWAGVGDGPR